jgi:hypothetical protein
MLSTVGSAAAGNAMSWGAVDDVIGTIHHALATESVNGPEIRPTQPF